MATTKVLRVYLCIIICFQFLYDCECVFSTFSLNKLDIPSHTNSFIRQNYQQYDYTVTILDIYLSEFRANYFDRIESLQLNEEFLQQELNKALLQMIPLDAFDDVRSFCVHKYRTNLPDVTITTNSLISCKEKAINAYNAIVAAPTTTTKYLKNYFRHQFANALTVCARRYPKNEQLHMDCLLKAVKSANAATTTNVNSFHKQLKQSLFAATTKIQETFGCHALIVFKTISKIGQVNGLLESCATTRESRRTSRSSARCPYQMSLSVDAYDAIRQDNLHQTLKTAGRTTPCLQFNFIREKILVNVEQKGEEAEQGEGEVEKQPVDAEKEPEKETKMEVEPEMEAAELWYNKLDDLYL